MRKAFIVRWLCKIPAFHKRIINDLFFFTGCFTSLTLFRNILHLHLLNRLKWHFSTSRKGRSDYLYQWFLRGIFLGLEWLKLCPNTCSIAIPYFNKIWFKHLENMRLASKLWIWSEVSTFGMSSLPGLVVLEFTS